MPLSVPSSSRQGVEFRREVRERAAAQRWLEDSGYRLSGMDAKSLRVITERLDFPRCRISRIWQTPATLSWGGHPSATADSLGVLYWLEGRAELSIRRQEYAVGPGTGMLLIPNRATRLRLLSNAAYLVLRISPDLVEDHAISDVELDEDGVLLLNSAPLRSFTAFSTSLLADGQHIGDLGWRYLEASLVALFNAVLEAAGEETGDRVLSEKERLFRSAGTLIQQRAHRREFTSASLAGELGVTLRKLQRIFAERNTKISAELTLARVRLARRRLGIGAQRSAVEVDEVARSCGFSSRRSLYAALRAHPDPAPHEPDGFAFPDSSTVPHPSETIGVNLASTGPRAVAR